jgi:shikimate dehydrogenase
MTDRYAVIGNPVAHSRSPRIHAEFSRQTGEPISYDRIHAEPADFEAVVERFRASGGRGLNVTVPFKHRAHALATHAAPRATQAGAANTLRFDGAAIDAHNTDGIGLVRDIVTNLGCGIAGRRVLLMGAGGASYGVCGPLLEEKPASLLVVNRTRGKAVELAQRFAAFYPGLTIVGAGYDEIGSLAFDVVINATSSGLAGEMPPLARGVFAEAALAYDMMYGRPTRFLQFAAEAGARVADGLGMLVEQAAESFAIWRGVRPQTAPVIALLRSEAGAQDT